MMNRRSVLSTTATLSIASVAGCASAFNEPAQAEVTDSSWEWGVPFELTVLATVYNQGGSSYSGTLVVQAEPGGVTYTERRGITVRPGDSNTFRVEFQVDSGDYGEPGQYEVRLE